MLSVQKFLTLANIEINQSFIVILSAKLNFHNHGHMIICNCSSLFAMYFNPVKTGMDFTSSSTLNVLKLNKYS